MLCRDLACVDRFVSKYFRHLGREIAKNPGYFVIVPILVAALFGSGLQRIRYEDDPEYLFTPTNGRSKTERRIVETLFPMNSSKNFDLGRITRPGHFGRVIVVPRDEGSVLRSEVFDEIDELNMIVQNLTIHFEERLWRYEDICARKLGGHCFKNDILDFKYLVREMEENPDVKMTFPLMQTPNKVYFLGGALGGVGIDENNVIVNCSAANLMYYLDWSNQRAESMARLWEATFLETVDSLNDQFEYISLAMFVSNTLTKELQKNTQSVVPFLSLTLVIMLVFSIVTCMMADWVKSKPWLGVIGCISSIMGVGAAFGLIMYFNLEFIGINLAAPFLMLGIGMDDSFVLLASWRRTDPKLSVVDRLGETYAEAAVSVTITSLTNFISFWIGAITPFPSVRIFCIYTATAVLFTYIYQLTFFGGCMAISGIAEERSLHAMFCVPTMPKSLAKGKSWCYRVFCTGGKNDDDPDNPMDNQEHSLMVFFRDYMGVFLSKPWVKASVVLCFMMYLAVGIWGCLQVREGLERYKLSRSDSYSVTFYEREDKYFRKYAYRIQVVVNATLDYSNETVQTQIESMLQKFESSPYVSGPDLTESWLRAFNRFTNDTRTSFILQSYNKSDSADFIKILDVFFNYPLFQNFRHDVLFNEDKSKIVATRYVIQAYNIIDANKEKDMVLELRKIADTQPFSVNVFQQYFIYFDQFILVRDTSIQSICVAVAVMIFISLLFIPSLHCAVFVAFSIISIEVGVIGYMTLWGVNLDSISMINLIMCIGFSVDYSAHISYAYFSSEKKTPNDGIRAALHSLGVPIFQGSISTILGVIALIFAPSYIFLTFFKTVFLVILFGALHGILLLPVLLSLSDSCFNSKVCSICRHFSHSCICNPLHSPEKAPIPSLPIADFTQYGVVQPPRLMSANGFLAPETRFVPPLKVKDVDDNSSKGSKLGDLWQENGDKDLGIGTSGESSDGSWKCPHEDRERSPVHSPHNLPPVVTNSANLARRPQEHDNPAFSIEEEVHPAHPHHNRRQQERQPSKTRSSSCSFPRDRMRSYIDDVAINRSAVPCPAHEHSAQGRTSRENPNYFFHGPPRRPISGGHLNRIEDWVQDPRERPRRSRDRTTGRDGEPDKMFTVRL
ncbi:patched domain-containing protein 3 [Parasteatoda tepidariorum]|uniref:patched domain-containing protein 3 n=1 Tax=Parasteatoda tepidariorum TaxID=114398 RepID=UPI00077FD7C5|nr:patched domain-containing protein 3 [Parasteatoda tepidariorum]